MSAFWDQEPLTFTLPTIRDRNWADYEPAVLERKLDHSRKVNAGLEIDLQRERKRCVALEFELAQAYASADEAQGPDAQEGEARYIRAVCFLIGPVAFAAFSAVLGAPAAWHAIVRAVVGVVG